MSYKTIYTCDRCKSEQATAEKFWTLQVTANHGTYAADGPYADPIQLQVCRKCLDELQFFEVRTRARSTTAAAPEVKTIEDMIREIVSRCVEPGQ